MVESGQISEVFFREFLTWLLVNLGMVGTIFLQMGKTLLITVTTYQCQPHQTKEIGSRCFLFLHPLLTIDV